MHEPQQLPTYDRRDGTGPTLVLLHHWGGSARTWDLVTAHLADRDVLTLDLRGWSRSKSLPGPYGLRQLAADTLAVIADTDLTDYVVVGHSMGGKVAQLVAARNPSGLRGLVLVAPAPAAPAEQVTPGYREQLSHAYDSEESTAQARDDVLTATRLPADLAAQVVEDSRASAEQARTEWPLHGIAEDVTAAARAVTVPVHVVAGEHDRVEPVEVLRTHLLPHIPQATLTVVPRAGHLIPLEAPRELAEAIGSCAW